MASGERRRRGPSDAYKREETQSLRGAGVLVRVMSGESQLQSIFLFQFQCQFETVSGSVCEAWFVIERGV